MSGCNEAALESRREQMKDILKPQPKVELFPPITSAPVMEIEPTKESMALRKIAGLANILTGAGCCKEHEDETWSELARFEDDR